MKPLPLIPSHGKNGTAFSCRKFLMAPRFAKPPPGFIFLSSFSCSLENNGLVSASTP
jgi:hypothetical protein